MSPFDHETVKETDLEEGVHSWLDSFFCNDPSSPFRGDCYVVANTARGGSARGRWTRPDITLIAIQKHRMTDRTDLELYGFELKRDGRAHISGVFEAVAHTRFVHYAYLALHLIHPPSPKAMKDIELSCQSNGIGLITFGDPHNSASFKVILTPVRKSPHPYDVDQYLLDRLQPEDLKNLDGKIRLSKE